MRKSRAHALSAALLCTSIAISAGPPQNSGAEPVSSRAAEIEAARKRKAQNLTTTEQSGLERALLYVKDQRLLDKWKYGWKGIKPRVGALVTGSGFAAGPEFRADNLGGGFATFRVTTQFSTHLYQLYEAEVSLPRLVDNKFFFTTTARHRNFPRMPYYGPGPDSLKTGRSNYRLEDTSYGFRAGVVPDRRFSFGITGNMLNMNVGPGTDERYISTDRQFSELQTPGLDRQSNFFQSGGFARLDTRDIAGGPRSGTLLQSEFLYNKDVGLETGSHKRLNVEGQQYIPFFNQRRVIALRARSELTWKDDRQVLPFYLQPTLGGSDDLRGYRPFRFYGDNKVIFNAEYRYEIFAGLDMALFGDAGKVFQSKSDWNLDRLEAAYGFGFRFNARNAVFARLDVGFSHEGFQVWLKFNNIF